MKLPWIRVAVSLVVAGWLSSCGGSSDSPTGNRANSEDQGVVSKPSSVMAQNDVQPGGGDRFSAKLPGKPVSTSEVEDRYSPAYKDCTSTGEAAEGVTSALMDCNGPEIELQDSKLNQAYKMVMSRLPGSDRSKLRAAENAWITARDKGCEKAMGDEAEGSLGSVIYSGCILNETIKRTIWLERLG